MARKPEIERYGEWVDRIKEREKFLRRKIHQWNKYMRMYRMTLTPEEEMSASGIDGDTVWLNYHFGLSRIILPSIYFKNPDVLITPLRGTPLSYTILLEKLVNKQLTDLDFDTEMRKIVFDTLFCSIGIMKFGYAPALRKREAQSVAGELAGVGESFFDEDLWDSAPPGPATKLPEFDQRIPESMPFGIRVSPRNWLVDPMAATDKQARWMIHKILKPVDDVKKSKLYSRALTSGMEGNLSLKDEAALNEVPGGYAGTGAHQPKIYDNLVYLYEIWDRETDKLMVLDSYNMDFGERKFLRDDDNPYDIEGFPFEILCFNPDSESPYGVADAETWYNPTNVLNLLNTIQYEHVKRALPKHLIRKGAMSEEEKAKLTSPRMDATAEVDGEPAQDVQPLQVGTISPDLYALREVLRNELTFISGVTEQKRGGSQKSQTATEASIIDQQSRVRDSDRLNLVSKFVVRAARKLLMLNRQFLDVSQISFVVGPEAMQFWREAGPDVIRSEVDVKVRVGTSAFMSREVRAKQLLDFLNLTMGIVDPLTQQPLVNIREVIRRVAEALEIEDFEALIAPATPPPQPGMYPELGMAAAGGGGNGPQQGMSRRQSSGGSAVGDLFSGVQNLGVRRTPNPTSSRT